MKHSDTPHFPVHIRGVHFNSNFQMYSLSEESQSPAEEFHCLQQNSTRTGCSQISYESLLRLTCTGNLEWQFILAQYIERSLQTNLDVLHQTWACFCGSRCVKPTIYSVLSGYYEATSVVFVMKHGSQTPL